LNESFPRSIRFCVQKVDEALRRFSGVAPGRYTNDAEKVTGRLLAELSFSTIEDYYSRGLHQAVDDLQVSLNNIGRMIFDIYIDQDGAEAAFAQPQPFGVSDQ